MSRILTLDNKAFNLNELPEEVEEDARFSVLDNSEPGNPDFFFMPLIFLESFNSPAILMNIGGYEIQMPLDWCMLIGDSDCATDPEVLPLTSINERGFEAFVFNPINFIQMFAKTVKMEVHNYPNPFLDHTIFRIDQSRSGENIDVEIKILDMNGVEIVTLTDKIENAKTIEEVYWDGSNQDGSRLSAGIYYYSIIVRYELDASILSKVGRLVIIN